MKTLYTFGYLGGRAPRILAELLALHTPLIDIRFSPTSRRYEWTQEALQARLGTEYVWIKELGNELYKEALTGHYTEPHVRLHNSERGLAQLKEILDIHGRAAIFCACASPKNCHRTIVARIAEQCLTCKIVHL